MNTAEINRALEGNPITKYIFRGVFSCDNVPDFDSFPSGCVVNTDPASGSGSHWIALFQPEPGVMETFDSFGRDLGIYSSHFANFLHECRLISQPAQLQSINSTVCGQYCLFFLLRRASGESYPHIVHLFTDYKKANDIMVCQYVNHYFNIDTPIQDQEFLNQIN